MAKKSLNEIEIIRELSTIINEEGLHEIEIEKKVLVLGFKTNQVKQII